jgi:hypothetical protein
MDLRRWRECIQQLGGLTPLPDSEFFPVPEEELKAIEAKCGAKLPDDYREFLATYGSSTFSRFVAIRSAGPLPTSLSDDGLLPFDEFYGTVRLADQCPSVLLCIDTFQGDIPDGLLPIANGWNDDQICMGLVGELCGKIFYWDSQGTDVCDDEGDGPTSPAKTSYLDTYYVADSFTDLLSRLEAVRSK